MDKLDRKINVWKIIMLISLLILFFTLLTTKTNSCLKCKFEYEGKEYGFKEFLSIYKGKCLKEKNTDEIIKDIEGKDIGVLD